MTGAGRAPVSVFIVDDHPLARAGIAAVLSGDPAFVVCGEAGDAASATAAVDALRPSIAVVDLDLGRESGLALVEDWSVRFPALRVLVISAHDEQLHAARAIHAGAAGYVMKHQPADDILTAIRQVAAGRVAVSDAVSDQILTGASSRAAAGALQLTAREREILEYIARGAGSRDIAGRLGVSPKTIDSHCANIKTKLGLRSSRELIRFAVSWVEHGR